MFWLMFGREGGCADSQLDHGLQILREGCVSSRSEDGLEDFEVPASQFLCEGEIIEFVTSVAK